MVNATGIGLKSPKKGERRGGRKAGVPNKSTQILKDALLNAASELGFPEEVAANLIVGLFKNEVNEIWAAQSPKDVCSHAVACDANATEHQDQQLSQGDLQDCG
jgi:hypothetical protein